MGSVSQLAHQDRHGPHAGTSDTISEIATDDQTGKPFEIVHENVLACLAANFSALYLFLWLGSLLWLLFDTWSGRNYLLSHRGYDLITLTSAPFRLMAIVAIGGALGGTVDGIRSIIVWHAERNAYGPRFLWKDISLPLIGAAVGLIAYMTVRSGVGVFNGDFSLDQKGGSPEVAAFAVASLAGFSALQVFRWLDAQANKLFNVAKESQTIVPNLEGMTVGAVAAALKSRKLVLGHLNGGTDKAAKVARQSPGPGSVVPELTAVDISIAEDNERENPDTPSKHPHSGQLTLEDIAAYLEVVFEDGDPALIARALDAAARSRGLRR